MLEKYKKQDFLSQFELVLINEKQWRSISKRYNMTPREVEVAKLVCKGYKNKQISEILSIKVGTVKIHIRNIYRRVNTKTRIETLLEFLKYIFATPRQNQNVKYDITFVDSKGRPYSLKSAQTQK